MNASVGVCLASENVILDENSCSLVSGMKRDALVRFVGDEILAVPHCRSRRQVPTVQQLLMATPGRSSGDSGYVCRERKTINIPLLMMMRVEGQDARGSASVASRPTRNQYHQSLVGFAPSHSHVDAPSRTCSPHPSLCAPRADWESRLLCPLPQAWHSIQAHGKIRWGLDRFAEKRLAAWGMAVTLREFRLR